MENGDTLEVNVDYSACMFKLNNSLSFENYFKYLKTENRANREYGSPLVTVYYPNKDQRQYFNDDGLDDKFTKLDKLSLIRKKLYPNDKFFETPEPPPPPPSRK